MHRYYLCTSLLLWLLGSHCASVSVIYPATSPRPLSSFQFSPVSSLLLGFYSSSSPSLPFSPAPWWVRPNLISGLECECAFHRVLMKSFARFPFQCVSDWLHPSSPPPHTPPTLLPAFSSPPSTSPQLSWPVGGVITGAVDSPALGSGSQLYWAHSLIKHANLIYRTRLNNLSRCSCYVVSHGLSFSLRSSFFVI